MKSLGRDEAVVCSKSKCSRRCGAFVSWVDRCTLGSQAVRKVIDRPISRAERMALVLRITRFIGTTMKPAWHASCHPCAQGWVYLARGLHD